MADTRDDQCSIQSIPTRSPTYQAVGLLTDSPVTVVASMLVSPLMGPILAIAFGLTILDFDMVSRGCRNVRLESKRARDEIKRLDQLETHTSPLVKTRHDRSLSGSSSAVRFLSPLSLCRLLADFNSHNNSDFIGMLTGLSCGPFFDPLASEFGIAFGVNTTIVSAEMSSRGTPWSLLSGFFVAMPSGVGVALGISGGGINALVGVAISAALLPPIVRC